MHWGWFSKLKASLWVAWLLHVTLLGMRADDWEIAAFWKLSKAYFQRIVRTIDAETTTKQNAMLLSAQTLLKSFDPLVVQFVPQFDDVWWYQTLGHPGSVLDACIGWSNRAFMCVCLFQITFYPWHSDCRSTIWLQKFKKQGLQGLQIQSWNSIGGNQAQYQICIMRKPYTISLIFHSSSLQPNWSRDMLR